jgi:hypothetical protein
VKELAAKVNAAIVTATIFERGVVTALDERRFRRSPDAATNNAPAGRSSLTKSRHHR